MEECFSRFLNCTNATKSRNASQTILLDPFNAIDLFLCSKKQRMASCWKSAFLNNILNKINKEVEDFSQTASCVTQKIIAQHP